MDTFTCPVCGEYEGTAPSVQAHISSKNDPAHKGMVGSNVMVDPENQEMAQNGQQAGQNGQQKERPGNAQGKQGELPDVECENCGRSVKYPELMPHGAPCPECGSDRNMKSVFKEVERQADEPGNDETKGVKKAKSTPGW